MRKFLEITGVLGMICALPAQAQQTHGPRPDNVFVGEGEVDVQRGVFNYSNIDITIGGEGQPGALTLKRSYGTGFGNSGTGGTSQHNHFVRLYMEVFLEDPFGYPNYSYRWHVVIGGEDRVFQNPFNPFGTTMTGGGPTPGYHHLVKSSNNGPYTYYGPHGLVIQFGTILGANCEDIGVDSTVCATASSITYGDGTRFDYHYDAVATGTPFPRVRQVVSNAGYALGFEYRDSSSLQIQKVCSVNLALVHASSASPCPAGARSVTYGWSGAGYSGNMTSLTDASGQITTYGYGAGGGISSIRGPSSTVDDVTITYNSAYFVSSVVYAGGDYFNYSYENTLGWNTYPYYKASNQWTEVTTASGMKKYDGWSGLGAQWVTDPLGRTVTSSGPPGCLSGYPKTTHPEGNSTERTCAVRGNVTETRHVAKPGSGLADIVTSSVFPVTCSNIVNCDKPTSTTDANGNTTDYTYDPTHGGILTATAPAPTPGANRPVKRFAYSQKRAWIKDSGGNYAQAAYPVWLLAEERFCNNSATIGGACAAGSSDETVTSYDYGPDSGPNNLLLRSKAVTSNGVTLRTCYTYDALGNRISETTPRGAVSACP